MTRCGGCYEEIELIGGFWMSARIHPLCPAGHIPLFHEPVWIDQMLTTIASHL